MARRAAVRSATRATRGSTSERAHRAPSSPPHEGSTVEETPVDVTRKYIEGLDWPASKEDVLGAAERNGAPDDVLDKLRAMEPDEYPGPNAVHNSLWTEA